MIRSFPYVFILIILLGLQACTIGIEDEVSLPPLDEPLVTVEPTELDGGKLVMKKTPDSNPRPRASRTVQPKEITPPAGDLQPIENFVGINRVLVDSAIAAASEKSGVAKERIKVLKAEAVEWRDSSLGCPKPGMMYLQVLSDGYHVILDVEGERFDYRSGRDGKLRLCENPSP